MTPVRTSATYRLQLGPNLDFAGAADLVEYLSDLGVSHVYLSPVLEARQGSTHGYDVANPERVSDDLGGEAGLRLLAERARAAGLGLVIDIVPNHVGTGPDNHLWDALLAEGPAGEMAAFFDVDWRPALPGAEGKVILPVLGAPYGEVLHNGELQVVEDGGRLRLRYHEHSFPLSPPSVQAVERSGAEELRGEPGRPETWHRLHGLIEAQHYRLVDWRVGDAVVNYRRFFAINELAAVRVEDEQVFQRTHTKILELVRDGIVAGLRIDHVDGLSDPAGYLQRLRVEAPDAWIVVEKILGRGEVLPPWPVDGTTGYDFLADCTRLFVDPAAEDELTEAARAFDAWPSSAEPEGLHAWGRRAKHEILEADLAADIDRLAQRLWELCQQHLEVRDVDWHACRAVLAGAMVELDVYRPYVVVGEETSEVDCELVRTAITTARQRAAHRAPQFLWAFLERLLTGDAGATPAHHEVVRRFQQVASAVMAKGVEDTLLYRHHRLVTLNEVGVEADPFGADAKAFHDANLRRAEHHPLGMLTTATHDTKRGEDVRLRIAALSEIAGEWRAHVGQWLQLNREVVGALPGGPAPDPATEYLLYQTMIGMWPLVGGRDQLDDIAERVVAYGVKAAREDGRRTSWTDPNSEFEAALETFVRRLLDPEHSAEFIASVERLTDLTVEIGMVSGLAQALLRVTGVGVPDTYQGLELWGDYLVDPDNRRPVDFDERRRLLAELDAPHGPDIPALVDQRRDGRVKLWVLSRALRTRRDHLACYAPGGAYVPLQVRGSWADHVVAFARTSGDDACITVAPRLPGRVMAGRERPPLGEDWENTEVLMADDLGGGPWRDALGGPGGRGTALRLAEVLRDLPVALLVND